MSATAKPTHGSPNQVKSTRSKTGSRPIHVSAPIPYALASSSVPIAPKNGTISLAARVDDAMPTKARAKTAPPIQFLVPDIVPGADVAFSGAPLKRGPAS